MSNSADAIYCQVCGCETEESQDEQNQRSAYTIVHCSDCGTPHHEDCWKMVGHCSTYGCGSETAVDRFSAIVPKDGSPIVIDDQSEEDHPEPYVNREHLISLVRVTGTVLKNVSFPIKCIIRALAYTETLPKGKREFFANLVSCTITGSVLGLFYFVYTLGLSHLVIGYLFLAALGDIMGGRILGIFPDY